MRFRRSGCFGTPAGDYGLPAAALLVRDSRIEPLVDLKNGRKRNGLVRVAATRCIVIGRAALKPYGAWIRRTPFIGSLSRYRMMGESRFTGGCGNAFSCWLPGSLPSREGSAVAAPCAAISRALCSTAEGCQLWAAVRSMTGVMVEVILSTGERVLR